jgi:uncharacterized cysteine cluster protein YcgN (CxxCxxCC family)
MDKGQMIRPLFWEKYHWSDFSAEEWEAVCSRCGRCCMEKLENIHSGELYYTCVGCRLFDPETCGCREYDRRMELVHDCLPVELDNPETRSLLPDSCSYRLLAEENRLPSWHPLVSGDPESVHRAGISVKGGVVRWFEGIRLEEYIVKDNTDL